MQPRTSVGRKASGLLLATLLALTAMIPSTVLAEDPSAPPPSSDPSLGPSPGPSADPSPDPLADPSPQLSLEPTVGPVAEPTITSSGESKWPGGLDPTGRYIVVVDRASDIPAVLGRQRSRGIRSMRQYRSAMSGFLASLDKSQLAALRADPDVAAVVPDEVISIQQTTPTGISRVFATSNPIADIDGVDERVDADIAIVDTGIDGTHPDLNVVGGMNCSTTNAAAWRDVHSHGTHVAGIAAARDDAWGVVGMAPGARLWAVKILNDSGYGYLSWYVCGLDWIAAQRDPDDPSRPLIEVANMSVAKSGHDDRACGAVENDVMHAAVCRLVGAGVTVVAAAGNDSGSAAVYVPAAYNEVITVSALADTDGKPGGLGGNRCSSFGTYDKDDTFADFSNGGSDVDLIAPGKCISSTLPGARYGYMSGTSMATPHVTGAVALYKESRPDATPAEVREALIHLGNLGWDRSSDRDSYDEKLLDVSRLGRLGTFQVSADAPPVVGGNGGTIDIPIKIARSATFFERVRLTVGAPVGWGASFASSSLFGFTATATTLRLTLPAGVPYGSYPITVTGAYYGLRDSTTFRVEVEDVPPIAKPPTVSLKKGGVVSRTVEAPVSVSWPAATDVVSAIAGYELSATANGTPTGTWELPPSTTAVTRYHAPGAAVAYAISATDTAGNESDPAWSTPAVVRVTEDTSASVARSSRHWKTLVYKYATNQHVTYATAQGAWMRFTIAAGARQVALVGAKGPTRGKAKIYIDGIYVATIDQWASTGASRVVQFTRNVSPATTHSMTVKVIGTAGRPR
ncbi:MAG TPA: S8 family peptidase, partial [Candidatus Limnocylindrales bacterium]|nr:S8 family peptidase [Candidatus Limnocylindrales bacterium]